MVSRWLSWKSCGEEEKEGQKGHRKAIGNNKLTQLTLNRANS